MVGLRTMSVIAWLLILSGALCGVLIVVALLGIAMKDASAPDLPYRSRELLAPLGMCVFMVGLGYSLRKQRAWAWDATMALLVAGTMLAGMPPLWYLDAGRRGAELIVPLVCSALALVTLSYAARVCASGPVRSAFLHSATINGMVQLAGVRVIAAFQWIAAVGYLLEISADGQTWVFGYPVNFSIHLIRCLLLSLFAAFVAVGLYRMKEFARSCAIGFALLAFLDSTGSAIVAPTPHGGFSWMRLATVIWCLVYTAVTIAYLIAQRNQFHQESAPMQHA